jgi:hypothetical protein
VKFGVVISATKDVQPPSELARMAQQRGFDRYGPRAENLDSGELLRISLEVIAASALFGVLGVAVGFTCRSQPAAVIVVMGSFLAEKLIAGVIGPVQDYLPYALLNSLLKLEAACPRCQRVWGWPR